MLEKIGKLGFETISVPDPVVLDFLAKVLSRNPEPVFYEIGVGVGATTLPVAKMMNNRGKILLFSRDKDVRELAGDLRGLGFENINSDWGSPENIYSGYHIELARGAVSNSLPMFDIAYIDGGHYFHLDAPATSVLKELCKPGGFMIFDDWAWSLAKSRYMNPTQRKATAEEFEPFQIEACHMPLVCKFVMDNDPRFSFLGVEKDSAIYIKKSGTPSILAQNKTQTENALDAAFALYGCGYLQEAAQALLGILKSENAMGTALALQESGNWQQAVQAYFNILKSEPFHPQANHNFGVLCVQQGQPELALSYFETALNADPSCRQYWLSYIDAQHRSGQTENAREILILARQHGLDGEDVDALESLLQKA